MWNIPDKVANSGVSLAGKHTHGEFNNHTHELEKAVTHTGVALTSYPVDPNATSDTNEEALAESMSRAASLGVWATDSGVANAYVLAVTSGVVAPKALFDGMVVVSVPGASNTTAATANVFGLGVKALRKWEDVALTGGEISAGVLTAWVYKSAANSGAGAWLVMPWVVPLSLQMRDYSPPLVTGSFSGSMASNVMSNISGAATTIDQLVDSTITSGGLFTCGTKDAGVWSFAMRAGTPTAGDEIGAFINQGGSSIGTSNVLATTGAAIANAFAMTRLAAGNTIQLQARQINGGAASRTVSGTFSATRIGA